MKRELSYFELSGLSINGLVSCYSLYSIDDTFKVYPRISKSIFSKIFNCCKNDSWDNIKVVAIEHDGIDDDGIPKNPMIIGITNLKNYV